VRRLVPGWVRRAVAALLVLGLRLMWWAAWVSRNGMLALSPEGPGHGC
jgi:hypothetical protein